MLLLRLRSGQVGICSAIKHEVLAVRDFFCSHSKYAALYCTAKHLDQTPPLLTWASELVPVGSIIHLAQQLPLWRMGSRQMLSITVR